MTDQYFSIAIEADSLGHQVNVYRFEPDETIWCEDLFRGFNEDDGYSYAKAREYAENLYHDLRSESVDVVLGEYCRDEL